LIYTFVFETAAGSERWVKTCAGPDHAYNAARRLVRNGALEVSVGRGQAELFRIGPTGGTNPASTG
jgi:hypothetical protein